jgi:hypothetical protein
MTNTYARFRKLIFRAALEVWTDYGILLSLYWDTQDVLSYLAAENDDEYIRGVLARNQAESNDSADVQTTGIQDKKSASKRALKFENIKETDGGHRIQVIQELQTVPVSEFRFSKWYTIYISINIDMHDFRS